RLAGQQHAGAGRFVILAVAIEAVLRELPAVQRGAGLSTGEAIGPGGQRLGQLRHAPARQVRRIGHAADGEPVVAIGHDADLVSAAGELLRRQRRALPGREFLHPVLEAVTGDEMDGNRVLPAIGLNKVGVMAHNRPLALFPGENPMSFRTLAAAAPLALVLAACSPSAEGSDGQDTAPADGATASATAEAAGAAKSVEEENDLYSFSYAYPAQAGGIPELAAQLDADAEKAKAALISES